MEFTFSQWGAIAPPLFGLGFKTVNTGKAQITGTEFTLAFEHKLQKKQSLQGFVGYNYSHPIALQPDLVYGVDNGGLEQTYTRTSLNASNSILKYRPQHLFKGDIMLNINNINLGIGATYQSQMQNIDTAFVGPISLFVPGMETSYNLKQTQYFIVNLRAGYSFDFGLKVNFIISNIANTEFAYRPADLGPPRSARVQIAYNIK
jgi:outer membrane receptor protein involved in Fe transport